MTSLDSLKRTTLRTKVLEEMKEHLQMEEEEIIEIISEVIRKEDYENPMTYKEREALEKYIYQSLRCYDVIQDLMDDDSVTEIMVNGAKEIFYEKDGKLHPWEYDFATEERLLEMIQQIVGTYDRRVNATTPIVDTRLSDGSRVHIVLPPVSTIGPVITIRKFTNKILSVQALIEKGAFPTWVGEFLIEAVQSRKTIFISGGTGSGKTTLLNALTAWIPREERIISIEDSKELNLQDCPNWVSLECKEANIEGEGAVSIRDLLKASLRMRPDRIIVGEVRGGECLDLLQALNTGHKGSLSTGHGNSCEDMLHRLETMALMGMELPMAAIRGQIAGGIDLLVHMERDTDGKRKLVSIKKVVGIKDGEICLEEIYGSGI